MLSFVRLRVQGASLSETEAVEQVVTTMNRRQRERAINFRDKVRKEALNSASLMDGGTILGNILQEGVSRRVTDSFDVQTFGVGPASSIRCATCEQLVNVVQGVAFSGQFGKCLRCCHPRCLHCVNDDIEAVNRNAEWHFAPHEEAVVYGRDVQGCFFCLDKSK